MSSARIITDTPEAKEALDNAAQCAGFVADFAQMLVDLSDHGNGTLESLMKSITRGGYILTELARQGKAVDEYFGEAETDRLKESA